MTLSSMYTKLVLLWIQKSQSGLRFYMVSISPNHMCTSGVAQSPLGEEHEYEGVPFKLVLEHEKDT